MAVPAMWVVGLLIGLLVARRLWSYNFPPTGTIPKRYWVVPRQ